MFITLGMLSVPFQATLGALAFVAVMIGLFLMFVARPLSVLVSLAGNGLGSKLLTLHRAPPCWGWG